MRLGCSMLMSDLHFKLHVKQSPMCRCGPVVEDAAHYFMNCPLFQHQRIIFLQELNTLNVEIDVSHLLFGNENISIDDNKILAKYVQKYIITTRRFAT